MRGDAGSFEAFRALADLLLRSTVMRQSGGLRLVSLSSKPGRRVLTGFGSEYVEPVPLNDGRYLRLAVELEIFDTAEGPRLKVHQSAYQYQLGREANGWICRYDYLRESRNEHPQAHLQISGTLSADPHRHLHKIHFPTGRLSLV